MKIFRLIIVCLIAFLLSPIEGNAQFGSPILVYKNDLPTQKECVEINSRKLIIMGQRWDLDLVEDFKRKKEFSLFEEYKDNCIAYSDSFIKPLAERWSMHDSFEIKQYREVKALYNAGVTDVLVLALVKITIEKDNDNKNEFTVSFAYTGDEAEKDAAGFNPKEFKALVLFPIEQIEEMETTFKKLYIGVGIQHQVPTKTDINRAVDVMTNLVNRRAADAAFTDNTLKQFAPRLKDYTLAISKKDWEDGLLIADAQAYYPYPIEKMDEDKYNELIKSGKPGYAYGFKFGNLVGIMLSDTRQVAFIAGPSDIPNSKTSPFFNTRDFNKINEAVTEAKIIFK